MQRRIRALGPALWLVLGFVAWLAAFANGRATSLVIAVSGPAVEKHAVPLKFFQAQQTIPSTVVPGTYAKDGEKTCLGCHTSEPATTILQTPHGVKADAHTPFAQHQCESCHGASPEHVDLSDNPVTVSFKGASAAPVAKRNEMCLTCHEAGLRTHWTGSQHDGKGVACTDCHTMHAKEPRVLNRATQAEVCFVCHKTQRAELRKTSTHALSANGLAASSKMACSDCHNTHGSSGPKLLIKNTVNDTCFTCHAEKRGPFLWEHAPVTEDCNTCHTPHGSTIAPLLKARPPWLCQECHSGDHGAQVNSGANLANGGVTTVNGTQAPGAAAPRAQMGARACLNCHVLIHGSNHPAGSKYQR